MSTDKELINKAFETIQEYCKSLIGRPITNEILYSIGTTILGQFSFLDNCGVKDHYIYRLQSDPNKIGVIGQYEFNILNNEEYKDIKIIWIVDGKERIIKKYEE
jgi:hypothetical protein